MPRHAEYKIVKQGRSVVIRDTGDHSKVPTVTNDVDFVVEELFLRGVLKEGVQLYYYDSENRLDQIKHSGGVFTDFAPGPKDGFVPD